MNISIFEVVGPVMVGPSSSHTAGAARLARIARVIAAKPFSRVSFGLHGSFAKTYKGHGTDKALIAGVLGLREDDERLGCAFALAQARNLSYSFYEINLEGLHENSVLISLDLDDGNVCEVAGSSIGGGQVVVRRINEFQTEFSAQLPTLVIQQFDKKGVIRDISSVLAENDINIGVMKLSRRARGDVACCIVETDDAIPPGVAEQIREIPNVLGVQVINILTDDADGTAEE